MNKNSSAALVSSALLCLAALPAASRADEAPAAGDPRSSTSVDKVIESSDVPPVSRRWGFSMGMGELAATGNRGLIWQTSDPMYDLALYYWATPQLALDVEGFSASNYYETSNANGGHVDVNTKHLEFAGRYYGDLHSVLSRIEPGFIRPFATMGAGVYSMTRHSFVQDIIEPADTEFGMSLGAGLQFEVVHNLLSLELMGKWNSVHFNDTYSTTFAATNNVPDLTGQIISWNANVLVTF